MTTAKHTESKGADNTPTTPRFVGTIISVDLSENKRNGKISHMLSNGENIKIFFHLDEFKVSVQEGNKIHLGQKVEYSVRSKKIPKVMDDSKVSIYEARNPEDDLKAVDCVLIFNDNEKMNNYEIETFIKNNKKDKE